MLNGYFKMVYVSKVCHWQVVVVWLEQRSLKDPSMINFADQQPNLGWRDPFLYCLNRFLSVKVPRRGLL